MSITKKYKPRSKKFTFIKLIAAAVVIILASLLLSGLIRAYVVISNKGEVNNETAIFLDLLPIFTLYSVMSLPFVIIVIIYLVYYRPKWKRLKMLQMQYNDAVHAVNNQIEQYLTDGLAISQEVWELPTSDTAAELFFELLEKIAIHLGKPVFYLGNNTNSPIAEQRMLKFVNVGLLAKTQTLDKKYWIIKLKKINSKLDIYDISVDLRYLMMMVTDIYSKLILANA